MIQKHLRNTNLSRMESVCIAVGDLLNNFEQSEYYLRASSTQNQEKRQMKPLDATTVLWEFASKQTTDCSCHSGVGD